MFIDTNVALDVLLKRTPFADDAAEVWALAEAGRIDGLVSAASFPTIYYIMRQAESRQLAITGLELLRDVFEPIPCDASIINQAIDSDFKDFEDAVQYFSARAAGAEVIVTRDASDYAAAEIPVMTPAEFLAGLRPPE